MECCEKRFLLPFWYQPGRTVGRNLKRTRIASKIVFLNYAVVHSAPLLRKVKEEVIPQKSRSQRSMAKSPPRSLLSPSSYSLIRVFAVNLNDRRSHEVQTWQVKVSCLHDWLPCFRGRWASPTGEYKFAGIRKGYISPAPKSGVGGQTWLEKCLLNLCYLCFKVL